MSENTEIRRSEDAAHVVTVTGWACKHCNRWWGDDERMARYCCATHFPCECGGRREKPWTLCSACRSKKESEKWYAKPAVEWDGKFPLAIWDGDQFFFYGDELLEYLDELDDDVETSDVWLTACRPNTPHSFDMNEFLCDSLAEDDQVDADEIDKIVNDWIEAQGVLSWRVTGERLDTEKVIAAIKAPKEADSHE